MVPVAVTLIIVQDAWETLKDINDLNWNGRLGGDCSALRRMQEMVSPKELFDGCEH